MERIHTVIIGAGVVGLACAKWLAESGREVLVIDAEPGIGQGTSSRNSEVVHAGIYYPQGSLKAITCVEGRRWLYRYAAERGIPHRRCGKLIVATSEAELSTLAALAEKARVNGLVAPGEAVVPMPANEAMAQEPQLRCVGALWSPSSGIIDSHALMLAYQGDAENAGAMCVFNTRIESLAADEEGFRLSCTDAGSGQPVELACRELVNAAGLHAPALARAMAGFDAGQVPPPMWVKGNYFSLAGRSPFTRLVYPVPAKLGLGVHYTLDLGGAGRFGPDTEPVEGLDYRVDPARGEVFYAEIRKYWPGLADGALQPAYAGIRPKLQAAPGVAVPDFCLLGPAQHGVPGLVHLLGIESPGLTASGALGARVRQMLDA